MSTQNSTHAAVAALRLYEAAHEDLFVQCCSNPIKNAWGKDVDLSKLNIAHEAAGRALNAAPALEAPAALLTKPARVGGGSFGLGVPERYVIEAAQRHYEQEGERKAMTAEQFAEEERQRRSLWELVHGPLAVSDEREAFEAFMLKDTSGFSLKREGESYEEFEVATYWHFWKARASLATPAAPDEAMVRYCPGCGSIGPVEGKYRDCCPDGGQARFIPQAMPQAKKGAA